MGFIRRFLGITRAGQRQSQQAARQVLREAASAKSHTARSLRKVIHAGENTELVEIARRKEQDAEMLRQLAAELDVMKMEENLEETGRDES